MRRPVAILGNGRRALRSSGPGQDRCNADRDARTRTYTHRRTAVHQQSVCGRTHARTRTHKHTFLHTPTGARCGARARTAAGTLRSILPLRTGTRTWLRRCSSTAPTSPRRTMAGAAHWSLFRATVDVRHAGRGLPRRDQHNPSGMLFTPREHALE